MKTLLFVAVLLAAIYGVALLARWYQGGVELQQQIDELQPPLVPERGR